MSNMNKLGLGTVQWGMPYGVSNHAGQTSSEEVGVILAEARAAGVQVLDTASLYGEAESVLGGNHLDAFRVISKTPRFAASSITEEMAEQLRNVFHQSLQRLSSKKIYGLLIHHADDLLVSGGHRLIDAIEDLKAQGMTTKIGVSVYEGRQIEGVLERFKPDIVQLPLSVLDQRLLESGCINTLKREGVEIHVRSVFLQGLLLIPLNQVPSYFNPIRAQLEKWHHAALEQGMTLAQAALSYVRDMSDIDAVLVGVESLAQFRSCLQDFSINRSFDASGLACNEPAFVNPVLWKGL